MEAQEFTFEARAQIITVAIENNTKQRVLAAKLALIPPPDVEESAYVNPDGSPTDLGSRLLTDILVQAISANINIAHVDGFKDGAKHLREVVEKLEKLFVAHPDIKKGDIMESQP